MKPWNSLVEFAAQVDGRVIDVDLVDRGPKIQVVAGSPTLETLEGIFLQIR